MTTPPSQQQRPDAAPDGSALGDFIASQRRAAAMSLRQLADRAGISNPYVSQIERGLRQPSAEVLQSLARALQVSATTLYAYAGMPADDEAHRSSVPAAVRHDPLLTEHQRQALLTVYEAFIAAPEPIPATQATDKENPT